MSLRIAVLLGATSAAVLLLPACFGGGGSEANGPVTTGEITSPVPSPTTTGVPTTEATGTESATGLADVPTTTEVGRTCYRSRLPPGTKSWLSA